MVNQPFPRSLVAIARESNFFRKFFGHFQLIVVLHAFLSHLQAVENLTKIAFSCRLTSSRTGF